MEIKLFDSELKLMELLWRQEGITAKELAALAKESIGWNKNTTYTVLKKLVDKKAVLRLEPNFICKPIVTKEQIQYNETRDLVDKLYNGSVKMLFSSFLHNEKITKTELAQIRSLIDAYDEGGEQ